MKNYCPSNLKGGQLTEFLAATFFPVLNGLNPNFNSRIQNSANQYKKEAAAGAVTLLYQEASTGTFGHISMVVHSDKDLVLPADLDSEYYVSFSADSNSIGSIITGTMAKHDQFGTSLKDVTQVVTVHNANASAMLSKWKEIKESCCQ